MKVYLGIGSNENPHFYIRNGLVALRSIFGDIEISPVYESAAVGFDGANFLNLVAAIETDISVGDLLQALREIENQNGRDRQTPRFSGRTLDIDILLYGDYVGEFDGVVLPREEILDNAYVLKPLSDIAPKVLHPGVGKNFGDLWGQYDHNRQRLWNVPFNAAEILRE